MKPKHGVQRIEAERNEVNTIDEAASEEEELSLEELSAAYSKLIGEPDGGDSELGGIAEGTSGSALHEGHSPPDLETTDELGDACVVTGRSIIEATLFVGNPENIGLNVESVAAMMRGVQATEIIDWIAELNQQYIEQGHVMRIVEEDGCYRMQLATEHQSVRDSMAGKLRETQLNQAAIDCLSLVAYRPGLSREELEQLWNRSASSVLGLLVRRELLRIERQGKGKQAVTRYFPTDRFLNLIGVASLDDLPKPESEFD